MRRPAGWWAAPALLALALLALVPPVVTAQSAYKYRDANGQWVFTDRAGNAAADGSIALTHEPQAMHVAVERVDQDGMTQLVVTNSCLCVVTVRTQIVASDFPQLRTGAHYDAIVEPGARQVVAQGRHAATTDEGRLTFSWSAALGAPGVVHTPPRPYRAPFALGATYTVTQAYPTRFTHVTPDTEYAVDFALPDGTPVYAAREGTVIELRHDSFRGAPQAAMLDQANMIAILHDDGTIAVYAHLHWDSVRVRIGQHVKLGEYIADSGNTGFTTGPHLHFAVWRNAGTADVSVPVQFAGSGGVAVTPATAMALTAY